MVLETLYGISSFPCVFEIILDWVLKDYFRCEGQYVDSFSFNGTVHCLLVSNLSEYLVVLFTLHRSEDCRSFPSVSVCTPVATMPLITEILFQFMDKWDERSHLLLLHTTNLPLCEFQWFDSLRFHCLASHLSATGPNLLPPSILAS